MLHAARDEVGADLALLERGDEKSRPADASKIFLLVAIHFGGNQNKHGQLGPTIGGLKQEP